MIPQLRRLSAPGMIATASLHAVVVAGVLMLPSMPETAPAASVTVSLISSENEQQINTPARTRPAHENPPQAQGPGPGPKIRENSPTPSPPASAITLPRYDADYLSNPPPAYPALSRRMGEQGEVLLRVQVREDGTPA
jgi:protein TonB